MRVPGVPGSHESQGGSPYPPGHSGLTAHRAGRNVSREFARRECGPCMERASVIAGLAKDVEAVNQ